MIRLTLSNKQVVFVENNGKINHWKNVDKNEWFFAGLAWNKKGQYAYTVKEILAIKLKVNSSETLYPVICNSKGGYDIIKNKITDIYYIEKENNDDNVA